MMTQAYAPTSATAGALPRGAAPAVHASTLVATL
jgi:hypothetical protein